MYGRWVAEFNANPDAFLVRIGIDDVPFTHEEIRALIQG